MESRLNVAAANDILNRPPMTSNHRFASRIRLRIALLAAAAAVLGGTSLAQVYDSATHLVTVIVQPVATIRTNLGAVNMTISGANAVAGVDAMSVTDQTSTLLWGTNSSLQKITVNTSLVTPLYTLKLLAVTPTSGTAASEVNLAGTAQDFILNIGRTSGSCGLRYTAVALASQGTGTDAHTITFTIQSQ